MLRTRHLIAACGISILSGCGARSELEVGAHSPDSGAPEIDADICAQPGQPFEVDFVTRSEPIDVAILLDITGSMATELEALRTEIGAIVVALDDLIAGAALGFATFADYARAPYGVYGDVAFAARLPLGGNREALQGELASVRLADGGDGPEAQTVALYHTATGATHEGWVELPPCARDMVGGLCFHPASRRVVLLITDAAFHNGPEGTYPYDPTELRFDAPTYERTVVALRDTGIEVAGIYTGRPGGEGLGHLRAVALDTRALDARGEPLVTDIGVDASGDIFREAAIGLLSSHASRERFPVRLTVVDGTDIVSRITAIRAEPDDGAGAIVTSGFDTVRPGTRLFFQVVLSDGATPGRYALRLELTTAARTLASRIMRVEITLGACEP